MQQDADEKLKVKTHQALEKALVANLPEEFEVPETLVENVSKERFASMLANMREQGSTDEQLKELITEENYKRYKQISRNLVVNEIKGNIAVRGVGQQQGLAVSQSEVDDEVMTIQAQTLQRGEKFRESEVRPRVEQQLETNMILSWMESHASVTVVDPKEVDATDVLGISPEELAETIKAEEAESAQ